MKFVIIVKFAKYFVPNFAKKVAKVRYLAKCFVRNNSCEMLYFGPIACKMEYFVSHFTKYGNQWVSSLVFWMKTKY